MKLQVLRPSISAVDLRAVKPPPKAARPVYDTPEYSIWRELVIQRAGGRCEAVDRGRRCSKARPHNRMFADHVVELSDGGAPFDLTNGQCLCGSHHSAKTARARAARAGPSSPGRRVGGGPHP